VWHSLRQVYAQSRASFSFPASGCLLLPSPRFLSAAPAVAWRARIFLAAALGGLI